MFTDVIAARELRETMLARPDDFRYPIETRCPICHRSTSQHLDRLPCQRRNEFDRYGLHHPGR